MEKEGLKSMCEELVSMMKQGRGNRLVWRTHKQTRILFELHVPFVHQITKIETIRNFPVFLVFSSARNH